jgi:DNA mismatch endonuclease, patch repair protein
MALTRSEQMARIRGRHTSPELLLRRALWKLGHRYRLDARTPCGSPDVVFTRQRVAVFVDGCFWHGCPEHYVRPRSRNYFWDAKLKENVERDRSQTLQLERAGWHVIRVWEHAVFEDLEKSAATVVRVLESGATKTCEDWRVVRIEEIDRTADLQRWHLESLRDPALARSVVQKRHTRKWKRTAQAKQ